MSVCFCKSNCSVVAVIASVIIGIIAAVLRTTAVITLTPAFLWVVLGIAVLYLAIILVKSASFSGIAQKSCICPVLTVLLTAILGAIVTSVILLGITFVATSIIGAIITGALLAFASLIFFETACLIKCLARCDDA
ncbi:MAG: hypothetical protein IJB50_02755 [Clostridia bacterium]|nr:hypothetical protein [Clostridia bacterium]